MKPKILRFVRCLCQCREPSLVLFNPIIRKLQNSGSRSLFVEKFPTPAKLSQSGFRRQQQQVIHPKSAVQAFVKFIKLVVILDTQIEKQVCLTKAETGPSLPGRLSSRAS